MPESEKTSDRLPIGFSMALAQNGPAMASFSGMDQLAQEEIIARARAVKTGAQMRRLVAEIGGNSVVD